MPKQRNINYVSYLFSSFPARHTQQIAYSVTTNTFGVCQVDFHRHFHSIVEALDTASQSMLNNHDVDEEWHDIMNGGNADEILLALQNKYVNFSRASNKKTVLIGERQIGQISCRLLHGL